MQVGEMPNAGAARRCNRMSATPGVPRWAGKLLNMGELRR